MQKKEIRKPVDQTANSAYFWYHCELLHLALNFVWIIINMNHFDNQNQ